MKNLSSTKKILLGLVILFLILAIIGYLIYLLFPNILVSPAIPAPSSGVSGGVSGLPSSTSTAQGTANPIVSIPPSATTTGTLPLLFEISSDPGLAPTFDVKQKKVFFFQKNGGDLYNYDLSSFSSEKLSHLTVIGLSQARWSPSRDRSALTYIEDGEINSFLLVGTSTFDALPKNIESFSWSPTGQQMAFLIPNGDTANLYIADKNGKNGRLVFQTPLTDSKIDWISPSRIAFMTAPSGNADGYLFIFSTVSSSFNEIIGPLRGLTSKWSSDGSLVAIESVDNSGKNINPLQIYNSEGKLLNTFDNVKTIADKCFWSGDSVLYCAVPNGFTSYDILPDDYYKGVALSRDEIDKIDLKTKKIDRIYDKYYFTITDLAVSNKDDFLIWQNSFDGTIWGLKIK